MEIIVFLIIVLFLLASFVGLVYPLLPTSVLIIVAYLLYGFYFGWSQVSPWFWVIQSTLIFLLIGVDLLANYISVNRFGGSRAAIIGSTIGLIIGPFWIPVVGIFIGAIVGAVVAELVISHQTLGQSIKVGMGSLIGFLGGALIKFFILLISIVYFFIVWF